MIEVLDHGYVKTIPEGCWGSDEGIIEAARMSTNKGFQGWGPIHTEECVSQDGIEFKGIYVPFACNCLPKPGDEKLLRYLWEHKHHTPFEMAGLTIEVQAPIMVFREWHRHRTQSYNEMSGRYTELPDLYYIPNIERLMSGKQAKTNKQSSDQGFTEEEAEFFESVILEATHDSRARYEGLLERGVAREIARLILPVNQYSRMRASANLRNWLSFLTLRTAPNAQWEIRQYANVVGDLIHERFPRTYQLFDETRQASSTH